MLLLSLGTAASAGYFSPVKFEIPVGGTGTFHLKAAGAADGDDIDVLQIEGSGSFQVTVDEPGDYAYEIYSKDAMNTARFEVFISVGAMEEEPETLSAAVSINEKGNERKILAAYYPILVVDPPVSKVIKGDMAPKDETFHFEFRAVSCTVPELKGNMPMPEGSQGQVKTLEVVGAGETEAGSFPLAYAGTYVYEFVEKAEDKVGWEYDKSVYRVIFEVSEGEKCLELKQTVLKDGKEYDGKTAEFTNSFDSKKTPKTGDESSPAFYAATMLFSFAALCLMGGNVRRTKKRQKAE